MIGPGDFYGIIFRIISTSGKTEKGKYQVGTVFRIFFDDIKEICRHFFVLVILIAVIFLPALYAWVNIYANGDPYVNTGRIKVAVASEDPGIMQADEGYVNEADEIREELKDDDKLSWQFPETAEEAIEGARSGEYYAAVVFEKNFTYNMHHLDEALIAEEPSITYYSNNKKNAIAAKITDTVTGNLLKKINMRYLESVFGELFRDSGDLADTLDGEDAAEETLRELRKTRDALRDFNASIELFATTSDNITASLKTAGDKLDAARESSRSDLARAKASISEAKQAVKSMKETLKGDADQLEKTIAELQAILAELKAAPDQETIQKLAGRALDRAEKILSILKGIRKLLPENSRSGAVKFLRDITDIMILNTEEMIQILQTDPTADIQGLEDAAASLMDMSSGDLEPAIDQLAADIRQALRVTKPLLKVADGMLDDIDPVLDTAGSTVISLDGTLLRLKTVLSSLEGQLDDIITEVESADEDERLSLLTELLGGDPDEYSEFFSDLVRVDKHEVYRAGSYGVAMTPFYSILAIWVGGVILIALLRTNVNRRKFPQITEAQGFFGRFLLFFVIAQFQAAVTVAGDIFILHCDPVHPGLMFLSAAVASLAFTMLIYAIVLSFGDIGKGIVVVIMVIQIAGSGGTYPIEVLPVIFGKIFQFFPFPYAINAMREAICGTYGHDYAVYLGELLIFGVVGVLIGLFVRRPFIGVHRFVTEKLEETEVL